MQKSDQGNPVPAIVVSWLLAGTLDIGAAFLLSASRHAPWQQMPQAIASGVLGAKAFSGGVATAVLGLSLHYLIMLGFTLACWQLALRWKLARSQPVLFGLLFGISVYAVMHVVVLPLSSIAFKPSYPPLTLVRDLAIHVACVGVPMALVLRAMLWPARTQASGA